MINSKVWFISLRHRDAVAMQWTWKHMGMPCRSLACTKTTKISDYMSTRCDVNIEDFDWSTKNDVLGSLGFTGNNKEDLY